MSSEKKFFFLSLFVVIVIAILNVVMYKEKFQKKRQNIKTNPKNVVNFKFNNKLLDENGFIKNSNIDTQTLTGTYVIDGKKVTMQFQTYKEKLDFEQILEERKKKQQEILKKKAYKESLKKMHISPRGQYYLKKAFDKFSEKNNNLALRYAIKAIKNNNYDIYTKMNAHRLAAEIYLKEKQMDKYAIHSYKYWDLKEKEIKKLITNPQVPSDKKGELQNRIKQIEDFKEKFLETKKRYDEMFRK